jgi:methoxymalonate biosynthesis acyl carrier protein
VLENEAIRRAAREIVADMTGGNVSDDQPLISSGLIDSISVLTLISRLEKKLAIRVATDSLQPDDFDSVDLIVETVQRAAE